MRASAIFWATVIPIAFVAAVLYVLYKIRRSAQERRQRSDERASALLADLKAKPAAAGMPPAASVPAAAVRGAPATTASPQPLRRRTRILSERQRVLFLILRAAMPEHCIMAHLRVGDLIEAAGSGAAQGDPRLHALARERLDFVVCDSELAPLAAIVLYEDGITRVPDESAKIDALREIGVRFLRFRADSLPRPLEMRHLVLS